MGRSKPPTHCSAPRRVQVTKHITENSSPKMNTFIKNARKQDNSDAAKMNNVQMDPPGGRRRLGRPAKVPTPESESSLSPVDVDSSNDGANVGGASGSANPVGSECRRSSRKKTIKFDVRDLLNKNRKSHKIQIEARIDSNAPKSGAGPASKEELDSKQKTFIEKSAIFRRYSFSENKQPPRPPPPPVALIKTIQQCVGELEQLPLDRDIDLAAISPIARRLSRTQEILTASMMKPKQVNSLIVTKLENATTTTPATTRRGGRQKAAAAQDTSTPNQEKRRGRPKKGETNTETADSTTESSNESSDVSEAAINSSPARSSEGRKGNAKSDEDFVPVDRGVSLSPTSSTKAIDLREKTDASAVTLSPSELMEPNMFVGAEEEVFTQGLSSDESTVFVRSPPKEKSNDEISLFGRSDSTETNSSDDSERRRKKIRVSVKRVTLPSAIREHVDIMLKGNQPTAEMIELLSSNDDESLQSFKDLKKNADIESESSLSSRAEEGSQDTSKSMKTRGSSRMQKETSLSKQPEAGDIQEASTDSAASPTEELSNIKRGTTSPQVRITPTRRAKISKNQTEKQLPEEPSGSTGNSDNRDQSDVPGGASQDPKDLTDVESVSSIQAKASPQQTKKSVQKQIQEVPSLQLDQANSEGVRQEADRIKTACSLSPRTRSQKESNAVMTEISEKEGQQGGRLRKTETTRSLALRKRKDPSEQKDTESSPQRKQADVEEPVFAGDTITHEGQAKSNSAVAGGLSMSEHIASGNGPKADTQPEDSDDKESVAKRKTPDGQKAVEKGQKPSRRGRSAKTSESIDLVSTEEETKEKSSDKLTSSEVETDGSLAEEKESPESESNPTTQSNTSSQSAEDAPRKGASPATKKTKKTSKHLARVISTDQSSSSSERSESPKSHHKKKPVVDRSKEDTSSICSESSSIESSSSTSSFSSTTASSKSSSTASTSSTSTSSSSDVHGRNTRSRRLQQAASDAADIKIQNPVRSSSAAAKEEQQFTEPDSENSEYSLRRGRVKTKLDMSSKDRSKLVQRRRSVRTNRFRLEEESNETSSESSETSSSTRNTRSARSRVRMEGKTPPKKTSRSLECVKSPKDSDGDSSTKAEVSRQVEIAAESKANSTSPEKQKGTENDVRDGDKVSEDQPRLDNRANKKSRRFAPLKGKSPERLSCDDTSLCQIPMRETRARRKTISSASELEELVDHSLSSEAERKKNAKASNLLALEETKRGKEKKGGELVEQQKDVGDRSKAKTKVSDDGNEEKAEELVKDKDREEIDNVEQKTLDAESGEPRTESGLDSPKSKVVTKSKDLEGLKLSSANKQLGSDQEAQAKAENGADVVHATETSENIMPDSTLNVPQQEEIAGKIEEAAVIQVSSSAAEESLELKEAQTNKSGTLNRDEKEQEQTKLNVASAPREERLETNENIPNKNETQSKDGETQDQAKQSVDVNSVTVSETTEPRKCEELEKPAKESSASISESVLPTEAEEGGQNNKLNSLEVDKTKEAVDTSPVNEGGKEMPLKDAVDKNVAPVSTENMQEPGDQGPPSSDSPAIKPTNLELDTSDSTVLPALESEEAKKMPHLDSSSSAKNHIAEMEVTKSEQLDDGVSEDSNKTRKMEESDDQQNKKQLSPQKKRKSAQQDSQKPLDEEKKEANNGSAHTEIVPAESNSSEDSIKSNPTKAVSKPPTNRQLDSSFIESLEKSLMKPAAAKRLQKKKEKALPATPKEKEDSKKTKKNQTEELKKADNVASPKPRKKQKDTAKAEKKLESDVPSKKKSATKNKSVEASKPPETSESKTEVPENKLTDLQQPAPAENTVPTVDVEMQKPKEVPVNPPKPMRSKGETKFYPDEHPKEHKLNVLSGASSPEDEAKEKSPDLVPDPLKDIEKFIEDGVNLLKRGYKLDEGEESAGNCDATKPDETTTPKKCKLDETSDDKKQTQPDDDNSNSNSEHSTLTSTPGSDVDTPNGIRRSHRIKNNSKSAKCLVGRGLVRDRERFSMKDDEKTVYSIDDQKMDLAEVEAKNSKFLKDMEERLSNFRVIRENEYKCERVISKEARRMLCDCFLTAEEEERGELGCGEDCLNRLLMIECGSDCTVKDRCTNRRFTKFLYSPCRVFRTEKKGFGIMADIEILPGEFIMEYVGEVIDGDEFERRRNMYSQDKNKHYYFMALRSDAIIDATAKGNVSRFINHSCDPNAETQKWTVNGELRIGFFSRKNIMPGEEITFDYQYQRYGKEAQKCFCESSNCRGWIGEEPSSEEEEDEEEEIDEEDGETETEEEEEPQPVPLPTIPVEGPSVAPEGEQPVSEAPVVGKEVETSELLPVFTPVTVEAVKPPKEAQPKKKKEKKRQLERKEEKIKRRETKQFQEDPDIMDEVRFLVKCGLRNQADTLRLSRLIVRAKLLETRLNLLKILRAGELPCRRLFLDYHGLRLLHGWMSEVIDTRDTEKSMEIRMALLSVLECLPIPNKTMLTDSKVYQTVRDWSNNKESHSPSDGSPKETTTPTVAASSPASSDGDPSTELQKLAAKLVNTWDNLPEVFRIPKRERIEQMKEHEREADRQYKGLGEDVSGSEDRRNRDRFIRSGPNSSRFKWSRSDKDKERERAGDRRRYMTNGGSAKDSADKTQGAGDSHLSKEQRRELFAAKVARDEAEKRLAEERREFDIKCRFFGLDPKRLRPENMPFCVNPATGQWYSTDKKPISTPPSYAHVQVPVKPKSTNPADYQLPIMDLPPQWKFAISPKGKIYYYHVKIRIPQWEPPIKILPLAGQNSTHVKNSESDSSNADCADSSDDDMDIIKGLDPIKLQAYIEKKIEDRRLQRYNRLVEEKPISPRKEEDRIYNQMEVRKYKENKEKIRKRKEEIRRKRDATAKVTTSIETNQTEPTAEDDDVAVDAIPIQDYLLSSDEEDKIKAECNNSPLIDKIVQGDKIVDELDALQCKRPLKRPLPIREKYEHKKRKVDKNKESTKSTKRSKDGESSSSSSSKYRKIREKFRCEIAGIIVQHLRPYRKETCFSGRILTDNDFNHLARKLTHFVMVKELKYCESIGQTLVVTESVKNKSREFIKKYMAKYGGVYVRPKNDPEFKEIPFL